MDLTGAYPVIGFHEGLIEFPRVGVEVGGAGASVSTTSHLRLGGIELVRYAPLDERGLSSPPRPPADVLGGEWSGWRIAGVILVAMAVVGGIGLLGVVVGDRRRARLAGRFARYSAVTYLGQLSTCLTDVEFVVFVAAALVGLEEVAVLGFAYKFALDFASYVATPLTGVGTPLQTQRICELFLAELAQEQLALHFHDTRGTALSNVLVGLELGIRTFDASVAGLGGCPYAPGASGNLATEDLVYLLHGMGLETGVDLAALIAAGQLAEQVIGRKLPGKVHQAGLFRPRTGA